MTTKQIILIFMFSIFLIFVILKFVKEKKISVNYSLIWFVPILILLLTAIFPTFVRLISNIIGFKKVSNMILVILLTILIFVSLSLTVIVTKLKNREKTLIQEVSILKSIIIKEKLK